MYVCIFVRLIYMSISYFSKQTFDYCVTSWLVDSNLRRSQHKSTYLTTGPHSETSKLQYLVARNPHHSHHASWCPLPVPHYIYIYTVYICVHTVYIYVHICTYTKLITLQEKKALPWEDHVTDETLVGLSSAET